MLLEKLELSSGFLNLEIKTSKPHTSRTSLLPSQEVISLITSAKEGNAEDVVNYIKSKNARMIKRNENRRQQPQQVYRTLQSEDESELRMTQIFDVFTYRRRTRTPPTKSNLHPQNPQRPSNHVHQQHAPKQIVNPIHPHPPPSSSSNYQEIKEEDSDQENSQQMPPDPSQPPSQANTSLSHFQEELVEVFELYCSLGDPLNSQYLSLNKFCKMMLTVNEMCGDRDRFYLNTADVELVFAKAVNFESENHLELQDVINFDQFLFALELVANKVYNHSPEGFEFLIKEFILPLRDEANQEATNSSEHIIQLMEILKNDELVDLLELIHQTLYPIFSIYSGEDRLMNLEHFIEFCQDFRIFPDILPDDLVINYFKTLSNFYSSSQAQNTASHSTLIKSEVIDEHLFVEVLALSALEMKFQDPQPSHIEKIIVLLDCMNNSEGIKKLSESMAQENDAIGDGQIDLLTIIKNHYPHLFQDD